MELADWIEAYGQAWEKGDPEPVVDSNVVAVEWWTTMDDPDDGEITLPGCLLLQFAPDGRCFDLREYWNVEDGRLPPHEGWGSWSRG